MSEIKNFYDRIQFPGHYSQQSLELQSECLTNPYLKFIDQHMSNGLKVLDVGCGTGLIANLFARRYPGSHFTGVDFADSVDYAQQFAQLNPIKNTQFVKQNFLDFDSDCTYDLVICQGVLHHIPQASIAITKLKDLVAPGGKLILGIYHPWGKIIKQWFRINYKNHTLYLDQEHNPYETAWTKSQICSMSAPLTLMDHYPNWLGTVSLPALLKSRSGGLVDYVFCKPK